MKNTVLIILGVALLVAATMFGLEYRAGVADDPQIQTSAAQQAALGEINRFTSITSTTALCNTTSSEILATSTGRLYAALTNNSTTSDAYISFGDQAVDRKDIFLGR